MIDQYQPVTLSPRHGEPITIEGWLIFNGGWPTAFDTQNFELWETREGDWYAVKRVIADDDEFVRVAAIPKQADVNAMRRAVLDFWGRGPRLRKMIGKQLKWDLSGLD